MSKAHLIIGSTGQGKSSYLKRLYKGRRALIYDVNNEHYKSDTYELPTVDDFVKCAEAAHNRIVIFEEATIFFKNNKNTDVIAKMLVRKRHTKQYLVFVFHSIRAVPVQIMDFCEIITLFPTGDNESLIYSKFSGNDLLLDAYRTVKSWNGAKIEWSENGNTYNISKYKTQKMR